MRWQWFENKIRTTLSGHRSEVDTEALWAAIEPQVDAINRDRKRRRPFLWLWLAGGLLAVGALWWLYQPETGAVTLSSFPVPGAVVQIEAGGAIPNGKQKAETAEVAAAGNDRTPPVAAETEGIHSTEVAEGKRSVSPHRPDTAPLAGDHPAGSPETVTDGTLADSAPGVSPSEANVETSLPAEATEGQLKTPGGRPDLTSDEVEVENPATATGLPDEQAGAFTGPQVEPSADRLSALNALPGLPLGPLTTPAPAPRAPIGGGEGRPALETETPVSTTEATFPSPGRPKAFRFSVGALGGVSAVDRKLESEARDSVDSGLLGRRQGTERPLEAAQAGLRLTVRHSSGLGLTTGVNYTQINERFRYETAESRVDSVYGVQYLAVSLDNDTMPVYGIVPLEVTTTNRREYYNHYRLLEVPLLADYRYAGRRFSLGAQAGVFVNLSLTTEGRSLTAQDDIQDFTEADIFRTNVGLSYHFGLSAGYFVTPQLELTVAPYLRHFPETFTKSSYGLTQRYDLYGVNVGMVYYLDRGSTFR